MDYESLKKEITNWGYVRAKKLFEEAAEDITLWDVLITEVNTRIAEKPERVRNLYTVAYMQSLGAYHSFLLNEKQKTAYQKSMITIVELCVQRIVEIEGEMSSSAA